MLIEFRKKEKEEKERLRKERKGYYYDMFIHIQIYFP